MFKETFTMLAIAAGLVATSAQAQDAGSSDKSARMEARFAQLDADSNGQVTLEELQAQATARFAAIDVNSDGALTQEEMTAARKAMHTERLLKRFDADGDGTLNAAELSEMGNGKMGNHKKGDHKEDGAKKDGHKKEGHKKGEGKMGKRGAKHFEKLDADGNGSISMEEMQARHNPAKMIEKLDADKSGGLSMEEFANARGHGKNDMNKAD